MSKAKALRGDPISWTTTAQFSCLVVRNDGNRLTLAMSAIGDRWHVVALETPVETRTLKDLFDSHAHKEVGTYGSPTEAIAAAESFAGAWLRDFKSTRTEQCACEEMEDT